MIYENILSKTNNEGRKYENSLFDRACILDDRQSVVEAHHSICYNIINYFKNLPLYTILALIHGFKYDYNFVLN